MTREVVLGPSDLAALGHLPHSVGEDVVNDPAFGGCPEPSSRRARRLPHLPDLEPGGSPCP